MESLDDCPGWQSASDWPNNEVRWHVFINSSISCSVKKTTERITWSDILWTLQCLMPTRSSALWASQRRVQWQQRKALPSATMSWFLIKTVTQILNLYIITTYLYEFSKKKFGNPPVRTPWKFPDPLGVKNLILIFVGFMVFKMAAWTIMGLRN